MMPVSLGVVIELLVSLLLGVTIFYCLMLERRLKTMRANEQQMRATVVELGMAAERAERAVESLRMAVAECDKSLTERLRSAERTTLELAGHIKSGDEVLNRITKIVSSARLAAGPGHAPPAGVAPGLPDMLAAAESFARRAGRPREAAG